MNEAKRNEESSLTDLLAGQMMTELMTEKDNIIREAINRKIGTDWTLEDLKGRCHVTKSPNTYEVFYLDGKAIVKFDDPHLEQDFNELPKHVVSAHIKYAFIDS